MGRTCRKAGRWAQATAIWDPTEAREAEAGQAPDGQTSSTN